MITTEIAAARAEKGVRQRPTLSAFLIGVALGGVFVLVGFAVSAVVRVSGGWMP